MLAAFVRDPRERAHPRLGARRRAEHDDGLARRARPSRPASRARSSASRAGRTRTPASRSADPSADCTSERNASIDGGAGSVSGLNAGHRARARRTPRSRRPAVGDGTRDVAAAPCSTSAPADSRRSPTSFTRTVNRRGDADRFPRSPTRRSIGRDREEVGREEQLRVRLAVPAVLRDLLGGAAAGRPHGRARSGAPRPGRRDRPRPTPARPPPRRSRSRARRCACARRRSSPSRSSRRRCRARPCTPERVAQIVLVRGRVEDRLPGDLVRRVREHRLELRARTRPTRRAARRRTRRRAASTCACVHGSEARPSIRPFTTSSGTPTMCASTSWARHLGVAGADAFERRRRRAARTTSRTRARSSAVRDPVRLRHRVPPWLATYAHSTTRRAPLPRPRRPAVLR